MKALALVGLLSLSACSAVEMAMDILFPEPEVKTPCDLYYEAQAARVAAENRLLDLRAEMRGLPPREQMALAPRMEALMKELQTARTTEELLWQSCPLSAHGGE